MKNQEKWKPSKFVYKNGKLIGSRDPKELSISSRLSADLIADFYDRQLKQHAKGRLLDLGCGKAPLYASYRDFVTDIICVDWNSTEYVDHQLDLTKPLPFSNEEFDTVILSDVLEHIPEPGLLMKEISRVLAKNGTLMMNVPFYYPIHDAPHDFYRYTEFALRHFVANADMTLIHLKPVGGVPEIIADIVAKNIRRISTVGIPLARLVQWFALCSRNTGVGGRISNATGSRFPLGYVLVAEKVR